MILKPSQCGELHLLQHVPCAIFFEGSHDCPAFAGGPAARVGTGQRLAAGPNRRALGRRLTNLCIRAKCERNMRTNYVSDGIQDSGASLSSAIATAGELLRLAVASDRRKRLQPVMGKSLGTRNPPSSNSKASKASSSCKWAKGTPSMWTTFWSSTS